MVFTLIPAGTLSDTPLSAFYLGIHPVTQAQWRSITGNNPSRFPGEDNPVERVSWEEAQGFIQSLNEQAGHARYRLPTLKEWAYAARTGRKDFFLLKNEAGWPEEFAWFDANSGNRTQPVGRKRPNGWGLYDMFGNVCEWVQDEDDGKLDPYLHDSSLDVREVCGGSWDERAYDLTGLLWHRPSIRLTGGPHGGVHGRDDVGFRLALSLE